MAVDRVRSAPGLDEGPHHESYGKRQGPEWRPSPDGRYVAYIEHDGDEYSLWVRQRATGGKAQVVPRQLQVLAHLTFSPDGEYIYFVRGALRRGGFVLSSRPGDRRPRDAPS